MENNNYLGFNNYLEFNQKLFEAEYITNNSIVYLNESFFNRKRYKKIFGFIQDCINHIYSYKPSNIEYLNDKITGNLIINFQIKLTKFQLVIDLKNLKIELNQQLINTVNSLKKNIRVKMGKIKTITT